MERILLLDEAAANIDSHTESQIQESIETIRGGKTIINVAHRLSTTVQKQIWNSSSLW